MSGDILRKKTKSIYLIMLFLPVLFISIFILNILKEASIAYNYSNKTSITANVNEFSFEDSENDESSINTDENEVNPFKDFDIETFKLQNTTPVYIFDERYPILNIKYENQENGYTYKYNNAYVKNLTDLSEGEVLGIMSQDISFNIEKNSLEPQILIMHTHGTESFQPEGQMSYDPDYTCRLTDNSENITSVGEVLADTLNNLGYNTLHDTSLHDYPSYNESYERSAIVVKEYLEKYPSIKIVLDVHRDAIEQNSSRVAAVTTVNGIQYAQTMIISCADNGNMNIPNYEENLKLATLLQDSLETNYTNITRPILFDYRHYNQDLSIGSLLIEIGSHGNTLSQAKQTAKAVGISLARIFDERQ